MDMLQIWDIEHEIMQYGLSDDVTQMLEFLMAKGAPKEHMMRLLILLSLTEGGLKEA